MKKFRRYGGYILMIMCVIIPILLLGIMYCTDLVIYHRVSLRNSYQNVISPNE
jgi:hypothetical protein